MLSASDGGSAAGGGRHAVDVIIAVAGGSFAGSAGTSSPPRVPECITRPSEGSLRRKVAFRGPLDPPPGRLDHRPSAPMATMVTMISALCPTVRVRDAAAHQRPCVLAGHSYGGAAITNAATGNPDVKALVHVDAFIPGQGENVFARVAAPPPGRASAETRPRSLTSCAATHQASRLLQAHDSSPRAWRNNAETHGGDVTVRGYWCSDGNRSRGGHLIHHLAGRGPR